MFMDLDCFVHVSSLWAVHHPFVSRLYVSNLAVVAHLMKNSPVKRLVLYGWSSPHSLLLLGGAAT
jgi:hypothetical protein